MPHHREGIQNELDKAYDEAHRDNNELKSQQLTEELHNTLSDTEAHGEPSEHEKAIADREKNMSPELAETIALLKEAGYLDTSIEGKVVHSLDIRSISKNEAVREFKKHGGEFLGWWEMEGDAPYDVPQAEKLDVMMVNFNRDISNDDALEEMNELGLRSLTREELLQYGIQNPPQKVTLVAINKKYGSFAVLESLWESGRGSYQGFDVGYGTHREPKRNGRRGHWFGCIFPVVRK